MRYRCATPAYRPHHYSKVRHLVSNATAQRSPGVTSALLDALSLREAAQGLLGSGEEEAPDQ